MQYKCHKMFCRSAFKDFHGPIGSCTKQRSRLSLKTAISRTNSSLSVIPSAEYIELSILPFRDGFQRKFFVDEVEAVRAAVVDFFVVEGDVTVAEADHCGVG